MRKYFYLFFSFLICLFLAACAQEIPSTDGVEPEVPAVQQEEPSVPPVTEEPEDTQAEETASTEEEPSDEPSAEVEEQPAESEEPQSSEETEPDADDGEETADDTASDDTETTEDGPTQEELEEYLNMLDQITPIGNGDNNNGGSDNNDGSGSDETNTSEEPSNENTNTGTGSNGRSDEEVKITINNFVSNYKNSYSFNNLSGEGLEYVDKCLDIIRNNPESDNYLKKCIEHFKSGYYDEEDFVYMVESWIEIGGPFGSGKISVQ